MSLMIASMTEDTYLVLEVSDEVIAILVLLQTSKGHLRARNVLQAKATSISKVLGYDRCRGLTFLGSTAVAKETNRVVRSRSILTATLHSRRYSKRVPSSQ